MGGFVGLKDCFDFKGVVLGIRFDVTQDFNLGIQYECISGVFINYMKIRQLCFLCGSKINLCENSVASEHLW
jgi:hypothetical protein